MSRSERSRIEPLATPPGPAPVEPAERRRDAAPRKAGAPIALPQAADEEPLERCELCSDTIRATHRHLFDLDHRRVLCACRACAVLFDGREGGGGRYRLVPSRVWRLDGFRLDDAVWETLGIPGDIAFFLRMGRARAVGSWPGPKGATTVRLSAEQWSALERPNPVLRELERDVEALLIDRARGGPRAWLVPVDLCQQLVGLIRSGGDAIAGGHRVPERDAFFERLAARASTVAANAAAQA